MSINRSMYIGLTGMNANSLAINAVGDNIANMNTVGFKAGRTLFSEMLGQSLMGGSGTMGGGVALSGVQKVFDQGALLGTGVATDMAIAGDGFFALEGDLNGSSGMFYSRAGQFHRNKEGFIVSPQGLKLQGYMANAEGAMSASLSSLQIDDAPIPPKATGTAEMSVNLNPNDIKEGAFDPSKPGETAEHAVNVTVYDQLGRSHEVTVFFHQDGDNGWKYSAQVEGSGLEGGVEGLTEIGSGDLTFENGKLNMDPATFDLQLTPAGLSQQTVTIDLSGSTNVATKGEASGGESSVINQTQDGSQAGTFQNLTIDADGQIVGTFSNGEERVLGQVALARFKSNNGLSAMGAGLFSGSLDSGSVIMGAANSGGRGAIVSGALEQSTVDLATEFTNMIIAQRGYQANSRTITTADAMMQEAVSLKR